MANRYPAWAVILSFPGKTFARGRAVKALRSHGEHYVPVAGSPQSTMAPWCPMSIVDTPASAKGQGRTEVPLATASLGTAGADGRGPCRTDYPLARLLDAPSVLCAGIEAASDSSGRSPLILVGGFDGT